MEEMIDKDVKDFVTHLIKEYEGKPVNIAEELKFEQAADIRNQIKFLKDGQFK